MAMVWADGSIPAMEEMVPASAPSALLLVVFGLIAVAVAQRGLLSEGGR